MWKTSHLVTLKEINYWAMGIKKREFFFEMKNVNLQNRGNKNYALIYIEKKRASEMTSEKKKVTAIDRMRKSETKTSERKLV